MRNVKKYTTQYFMPPVPCYDWTKKEYVRKRRFGAVWTCGMETRR